MSNNGHAGQASWIRSVLVRYEGQLTRYAQRITRDAERARDVVQETFLSLCREKASRKSTVIWPNGCSPSAEIKPSTSAARRAA